MDVAGLGNIISAINSSKAAPAGKSESFHHVLNQAVSVKKPQQKAENEEQTQTKKDPKAQEDLLSFLQANDISALFGETTETGNSDQDTMKMVKSLLGISDEKWTKILAELQKNANSKPDQQYDGIEAFIAGFSGLNINQLLSSDENAVVFVKAARVYQLLSESNSSNQQYLAGLLDNIQDTLQSILDSSKNNAKLVYLQNAFSQVIDEKNNKPALAENSGESVSKWIGYNGTQPMFQQMSKPEQLSFMLNGSQKTDTVNELISQFESILSRSQFSKAGGVQRLSIKLFPENLGSLRVELIQKGDSMTARILTTTDTAKNTLESHLHSLKQAFESQSIKIDTIEIDQQQSPGSQQGQSGRQQQDPQEQSPMHRRHEDSEQDFTLTLEEALINQEV